jgi:DNA-binding MarR family transcriptional regulator
MPQHQLHQLHQLHELDELLTAVRDTTQRPGYRRMFLQGLDIPGGVTTLRLLRAVEALSLSTAPSIKDVAGRLGVEHSTASRNVDAAVRAGLLTKHTSTDDLRRCRLQLTRPGRALLRKASARRQELLRSVTEGWPREDVERLIELLAALSSGFARMETST